MLEFILTIIYINYSSISAIVILSLNPISPVSSQASSQASTQRLRMSSEQHGKETAGFPLVFINCLPDVSYNVFKRSLYL